ERDRAVDRSAGRGDPRAESETHRIHQRHPRVPSPLIARAHPGGSAGCCGTLRDAMNFAFAPEHEDFRKVVRKFAEEVVAPVAQEFDEREEFPVGIVRQMGQMGLFGLPFPERYGGSDADFLTLCIAVEGLARVDSSLAITL